MAEEKKRKTIQEMLTEAVADKSPDAEYSVELKPDRGNKGESYLLLGDVPQLESQISLIMAMRQLFENYQPNNFWLGYPYEEFLFKNPAPLMIQIHWRLKPSPPWEPDDLMERLQLNRATLPRPYVTLLVDRKKISWLNVKTAAGGIGGRNWGPHYAVGHLKQSIEGGEMYVKAPSVKLYSSSEKNALEALNNVLQLAPPTSYTVTTGQEQQNMGMRAIDPGYRKPIVKVFPAWFTIINYKLVEFARQRPTQDRSTMLGKLMKKWGKIPLWHQTAPQGVDEAIRELVKRGDDE